jgi:hypothetical protein
MRSRTWIFVAATIALSLPTLGAAQQPAVPTTKPPKPAATAGQKAIKDADESNAYTAALNTADPAKKAAAMEAFAARYPKSVMHIDALEQAMVAYQQSGNTAKVGDAAERILKLDPKHVRALAIVTAVERTRATQGQADALAKMREHAELGLKMLPGWKKPEGTDDATYKKMRDQMTEVFNAAAGFAALQAKDYAKAAGYYRVAVQRDPGNLQDTYQLAISELESTPIDANGFWHIGRAIALAKNNAAALKSITDYGKARYRKYHGSEDGWDAIVARAATQSAVPANFAAGIKAAPTAADIAVQAVRDNDPADMSFSDYEFILALRDASAANKDAADKVWQVIQAKQRNGAARLQVPVKVISTTGGTVLAAISEENQAANKADVQVTLKQPMATPPAAGAAIAIIGVISDYVPSPFMFIMKDGEVAKQ